MPTPEIRDTKPAVDTPTTISPVVDESKPSEKAPEPEKPKPVVVAKAEVIPSREVTICNRLGEIVAEHGGLVSNIPAVKSHEYWQLKAELDALRSPAS